MSLTEHSLAGNNSGRVGYLSDIPAGDGKTINLFPSVGSGFKSRPDVLGEGVGVGRSVFRTIMHSQL